jgi:hypothetical protein
MPARDIKGVSSELKPGNPIQRRTNKRKTAINSLTDIPPADVLVAEGGAKDE